MGTMKILFHSIVFYQNQPISKLFQIVIRLMLSTPLFRMKKNTFLKIILKKEPITI